MTIKEYLKYSIDNKLVLKLNWVIAMFSIGLEDNDFIKFDKNSILVIIDGKDVVLDGAIKGKAVLNPTDTIKIEKGFLENVEKDEDTTVGRVLLNYVLLSSNFGSKVPYQNKRFEVSDIENEYITILLKDNDDKKEGISIDEYVNFVDASTYLQNWAEVISVSATEKSMIAPDGIKQYRKKIIDEVVKEHGPDALKDYTVIAEIENKLKAYDKEFLKDDPSLGKLMGGKILNNSRKKLFLMTGAEVNFSNPEDDAQLVEHALEDGYSNDPKELASNFNSVRFASYSRGNETYKGGLTAKILLRATSAITISKGDCKTNGYKMWNVTKDNYKSLIGRYLVSGSTTVYVEDINVAKSYIGKDVKMRSPMYCLSKGESICSICAGTGLSINKNSVPLIVTNIGGTILNLSMKAMHDTTIKTVKMDLGDMLS